MLPAYGAIHDCFLRQLEDRTVKACPDQHIAEVRDRRVVEPLVQPQEQPLGHHWISDRKVGLQLPENLSEVIKRLDGF